MVQLSTSVVLAGAVLSSAVSTLAAPIMNPDAVQARDEELEARIISPFLRPPAFRIPSILSKAPSAAAPRSIDEEAGLEARVVRPSLGRPSLSQIRTPPSLFKPNPALHQIASTMRSGRSFDEEADLEARIVSLGPLGRSPPFYSPPNRFPTSGIRPVLKKPSILSKAPSSAAAARSFDEEADLEARIIGLDRPLGPFSRLPSPGIRQPAVFRRPSILSKAPSSAAARSFDEGADLEARLLFKRPPPFYKMSPREIEERDFEIDELD